MLKSDFFYTLPPELIAQTPLEKRDGSRLMLVDKITGEIKHEAFYNICGFLKRGDLLVLNDSRVFPARIYGKKRNTGIDVEFLLLEQIENDVWETMTRPGRRLKKGTAVDFPENLSAEVLDETEDGNRIVRFSYNGQSGTIPRSVETFDSKNDKTFFEILEKIGIMPLPPYIKEKLDDKDKERYNTVYSREIGSSAAPTAGLHFTPEIFKKLSENGIEKAFVTLHVGQGTFKPVKAENIMEHKMHSEYYSMPETTAEKIRECKKRGGRVIAVGTTSCRTLETAGINAGSGKTDIFIYPGYEFKVIDGLITNFHLPESTLIMLVSAFLGKEKTLAAYNEAIRECYRFFSFGDAMFIT